jgi:hypothetical protein
LKLGKKFNRQWTACEMSDLIHIYYKLVPPTR